MKERGGTPALAMSMSPEPQNEPFNPYAPPRAQGMADAPARGPDGTPLDTALFTPNQAALAAFLGSPFGAALVIAVNERRLGRGEAAIRTLLLGALATGLLATLAHLLPEGFPSFPFLLVSVVGSVAIARGRHGAIVARHLAAGGRKASAWAAVGLGLLSLALVFASLVGLFVVTGAALPG